MVFKEKIEAIPEGPFMLFRSCVASNQYPGVETSVTYLLNELRIENFESDEQTCCTGCALFSGLGNFDQCIPVAARNLTIAEGKKVDVLVVCNGCYGMLNETKEMISHLNFKDSVNSMLEKIGRRYEGTSNVYHAAEVIYKLRDKLRKKMIKDISGLKIASVYGCHYLKTFFRDAIDDVEQPTFLEELVEMTGAEPVEYSNKMLCCGAGIGLRFMKRDNSLQASRDKLNSIRESEVDAIVTMCPYCLLNLDRAQQELNHTLNEKFNIPVIYISQLLALSMGMDHKRLGFQANITSVDKVLRKISE